MPKFQYISQGSSASEQLQNITAVLEAGGKWIQFRFKNASRDQFFQTALKAQQLCKFYQAIFIVNDCLDVAVELDADGIHLGLSDTSISEARTLLGPSKIIGGTANTFTQVVQRINENCDYVGLGPFRFTTTKEKLSPSLGLERYKEIVSQLQTMDLRIPIFAIGGITLEDIPHIMETGVEGIAVSGLLSNNKKIETIITALNQKIYGNA
jgi:thiamine-phosphate pyrophosphorylase